MHKYSQALLKIIMGQSKKPKSWTDDNIRRFTGFCFNKAPTCKCGCGEKTFPSSKKLNIKQNIYRFISGNSDNLIFADYIPYHDRLKAPASLRLTNEQEQAVLASILGDGYLAYAYSKAKSPRLVWNMGNQKHAKYKQDFFEFLSPTFTEKENLGWGSSVYSVVTSCHPCLKPIHDKYYKGKAKNPKLIGSIFHQLDSVGWAWFYGDDGHLGQNDSCFLHTEGYGEAGSKECAVAVNNFTKTNGAKVFSYIGGRPKKERFCVRMNAECSDEFMARIKEYMANGLEYKISSGNINRRYKKNGGSL